MSPAPTRRHQLVVDQVRTTIGEAFPENLAVTSAAVLVLCRNGFIPDVMLMTHDTEDDPASAKDVLLVVEVWSEDDPEQVRLAKRRAYAAAKIPFLWEIDSDELVGRRNDHGRWVELDRVQVGPDLVTVTAAPEPITFSLVRQV